MAFDKIIQLERVYQALDILTTFIRPALPFVNSHLNAFYTDSYWTTMLPASLREDLESQSVEKVKDHMHSFVNGNWRQYSKTGNPSCTFETASTVQNLISATASLRLSEMGLNVPIRKLHVNGATIYENCYTSDNFLKLDMIMSAKKMHEVEVMSDFITKIAENSGRNGTRVEYLVDVGSGKGYLSSYLTLLHKFKVLAVDSSSIHTDGCEKRSAKLEKVWSQLIRRAVERKMHGKCAKRGKHWKSKKKIAASKPDTHENENIDTNTVSEDDENKINEEAGESAKVSLDRTKTITTSASNTADNKLLKTLTQFVTSDFNLTTSIRNNFMTTTNALSKDDQDQSFGLVGLHTCGNLGVSSLRLFISNENAKFICNVPCCYHLLDENHLFYPTRRFQGSKSVERERSGDSKISDDMVECLLKPSFPISRKLDVGEASRFCCGRNARSMSAYSLSRMVSSEQGLDLHPTIFNRSVLQVLIKKTLGEKYLDFNEHEYRVGKIGNKCKGFGDYVRLGLRNLHLESKVTISDAEIEELYKAYSLQEKERLHKYYLLRSVFASIVEEIILLDRLAFLLEQSSVREAHIVELFEPALSPRCYAILALKD